VVFSVVASFSMTFSSESTLIIPPVTRHMKIRPLPSGCDATVTGSVTTA
jgi:hypothetical protein